MSKRKNKKNPNLMSVAELQQELKNASGTRKNYITKILNVRLGKSK